ncbi:MafI family immunity protein, partial [Pasteurella multocida]
MVIEKIDMLLEILRGVLSEEDFYNAKELVYYGEYGVAIELICTQLYEYD